MELRSVNYDSVILQSAGGRDDPRVALHFDAQADFKSFKVKPQTRLSPNTEYRLRIGGRSTTEPVDLAGLSLATVWQVTFTTER